MFLRFLCTLHVENLHVHVLYIIIHLFVYVNFFLFLSLSLSLSLGVSSENDFQWLCQLRYYWEETCVMARIINARVKYHCEYLGNSGR